MVDSQTKSIDLVWDQRPLGAITSWNIPISWCRYGIYQNTKILASNFKKSYTDRYV